MEMQSGEAPVLDLLLKMTADSVQATGLDDHTLMLVRIAALVAIDAPPASYVANLGAAGETGVDVDDIQGVLAGVAPIVGTARIVSAVGKMVRGLNLKLELGELPLDG
jgi:4-carboxymuconolactone decarboxylase